MVSRRKFGETSKDKWIDTLSVWNAALGLALWWLSPLSPIEKSYFKPQDFAFTVPEFIANIALYCYLFFILAYVAYTTFISTKRFLNWGKISLIASTYLWFASLLLFPDRYVFFFALIYIHGLPYIAHTLKDFAKPKASTGYTRSALTYFSAILILGLIYAGGSYLSNSAHPPPQALGWIEYLLWLPLIPHYYYDSLLWKHRSSFKKCL